MWLTLLWQNKGLVALVALLVLFISLVTALKVQSSRLDSTQAKLQEAEDSRDEAIKQHDQLVTDWFKLQGILSEREAAKKQQEIDNAKLRETIKEALQNNRFWAGTAIPDGVLQTLYSLPKSGYTSTPTQPK